MSGAPIDPAWGTWLSGRKDAPRTHLWYVAFDWGTPLAVLRPKDPGQLAEWRARRWTDFGGRVPVIVEVTASVADAMRGLYAHPEAWRQEEAWQRFRVVVWEDAPPTLVYGDAPTGEAVYVAIAIRGCDSRDGWRDLRWPLVRHATARGVVRPAEHPAVPTS